VALLIFSPQLVLLAVLQSTIFFIIFTIAAFFWACQNKIKFCSILRYVAKEIKGEGRIYEFEEVGGGENGEKARKREKRGCCLVVVVVATSGAE